MRYDQELKDDVVKRKLNGDTARVICDYYCDTYGIILTESTIRQWVKVYQAQLKTVS